MEFEQREELIELFDFYSPLLTAKQQAYFRNYYFEDYSITEIAEMYNVSRNAIFDMLKKIDKALKEYEAKLHLKEKFDTIYDLCCDEDKRNLEKIFKE